MKRYQATLTAMFVCAFVWYFAPKVSFADVSRLLSYQGMLTDSLSRPLDTTVNMTFAIYAADSGGSPLWMEPHSAVTVTDGRFSVQLGAVQPISGTTFSSPDRWLALAVGADPELSPRTRFTSVPYALQSGECTSDVWATTGNDIYRLDGVVGIGTSNPQTGLHVHNRQTQGNIAISGASDNGLTYSALALSDSNTDLSKNSWVISHRAMPGTSMEDAFWIQKTTNGGGTLGMMIRPNGHVGIGTYDPHAGLHVHNEQSQGCMAISGASDNGLTYSALAMSDGNTDLLANSWVIAHRAMPGTCMEDAFWIQHTTNGGGTLGMMIRPNGNVGIGTHDPTSKLHVNGRTTTSSLAITGGADIAEPFPLTYPDDIRPGMTVIIDDANPGSLTLGSVPYDSRVAGIVSGAGGVNTGLWLEHGGVMEGDQNVALAGRVYALATCDNGVISPGDMLTTSAIPGHLMKVTDPIRAQGAIVGKAMSRLANGQGLVLVLVNLQ